MSETPLSADDYDRLRRATATHRADLVVRLAGEAGLRPGEMTRLRPGDVVVDGDHHFLRVQERDGAREAYLPTDVEHDLRKYAGAADVGPDEPVFAVTPRRLQMLVREAGERAATGDADPLATVSSRDLRRYFARTCLRRGVPAQVVRTVGGWDRLESLEPLLPDPDRRAVAAAFDGDAGADRSDAAVHAVGAVADGLQDVDGPGAVAATACERLADAPGYRFAAVAGFEGTFVRRAAAGISPERADDLFGERARAAVDADEVRAAADRRAAFVPLARADGERDVLAVGTDDAPTGAERDLLAVLGALVGRALAAAECRRLLVADVVVELEFQARGGDDVFAALTDAVDCEARLAGVAPADGRLVCFAVVDGADAETVLSTAAGHDTVADSRLVEEYDDGAFVEVVLADGPAAAVHEHGARVRDATAADGVATLVAEAPADAAVRDLVDAVSDAAPSARLAAKRETERPVEPVDGFRERLAEELTERQRTALQTAFFGGYFEWPRGSTAEELADALDVSSPTLHNHLRRAEQKLLAAFFDDGPG